MSKETVLDSIVSFVLGHKYYANIVNTKGTNKTEVCSFIFRSKEDALKHKKDLDSTRSFLYIETISFRSRKDY